MPTTVTVSKAAEPVEAYQVKRKIELEITVDYATFSNEAIIQLIEQLEQELGLSKKIHILLKEKGSVLLTVEIDETEATQLIVAVNSGKLVALGITKVKVKKLLPLEEKTTYPSMGLADRLRYYKRVLCSGDVKHLLEILSKDLTNTPRIEKKIMGLLGSVNTLEQDFRKGLVDYEVKTRLYNQLHLSASDLLDEVGANDFG